MLRGLHFLHNQNCVIIIYCYPYWVNAKCTSSVCDQDLATTGQVAPLVFPLFALPDALASCILWPFSPVVTCRYTSLLRTGAVRFIG